MEINLDNLPKKGTLVTFKHRGATFQMTVQNARTRYGKIDVLLSPISGTGSFWVEYREQKSSTTINQTAGEQVFDNDGNLVTAIVE